MKSQLGVRVAEYEDSERYDGDKLQQVCQDVCRQFPIRLIDKTVSHDASEQL